MSPLRLAVAFVLALGLVGCGGAEKTVTMPDVTGQKLNVAYAKIKSAGFEDKDKVKIEGGGMFGVVKEANWTVCEQTPAAGEQVTGAPKLTIERSCDDGSDEPSESPTAKPTKKPTAKPTPELPEILNVKNSPSLASLLRVGDPCVSQVGAFYKKYALHKIQFDGSIANMLPTGGGRFNYLIGPGDAGANTKRGPNFQIADTSAPLLNITGKNVPEYVEEGQKYTFIATVYDYNPESCILEIRPDETRTR